MGHIASLCLTIFQTENILIGNDIEVEFREITNTGNGGGIPRVRLIVRAPKTVKITRSTHSKISEIKDESNLLDSRA